MRKRTQRRCLGIMQEISRLQQRDARESVSYGDDTTSAPTSQ